MLAESFSHAYENNILTWEDERSQLLLLEILCDLVNCLQQVPDEVRDEKCAHAMRTIVSAALLESDDPKIQELQRKLKTIPKHLDKKLNYKSH